MKRLLDIAISIGAIIVFSPIFIALAIAIKINMGGPILFRQFRPGKHGKAFEMIKFRTMKDACDIEGNMLPDCERMTLLGSFLRKTSLDELPGLYNVLCGDMSIVGPRPLLMEYLPLYNAEQARRHLVRPGLTGWAQINGRNSISWEEKFELDVWYVEHQSIALDIKIMILTLFKVLKRADISHPGEATMSKFRGE